MYEITHHGLWFRWDGMATGEKWLVVSSVACAMIAIMPASVVIGQLAYAIGYASGSGRAWRAAPDFPAWMAWWLLAFGAASAILWWQFSIRQDEMFNRIQNWALGMAGGWTAALLSGWAILALAAVVYPVHPGAVLAAFYIALLGFWFVAVRRWA